MKTKDALKFFGSRKSLQGAAYVSRQAVDQWGRVVPLRTARMLEFLTSGKLTVDPTCYKTNGVAKK